MYKWTVITLAALSVLLLAAGLVALILPDAYEGREIYRIDDMHSLRFLDLAGAAMLAAGSGVAWAAGLKWQRHTGGS